MIDHSKAEQRSSGVSSDMPGLGARTNWRDTVERTVTGLGYELVDIELAPRGLLRVFIDRLAGRTYPSGGADAVTVEDCEQVTRQLQYVLEVDAVDYARLEVSSPGLDRPLRTEADFGRFVGQDVSLVLKVPFQGRKNFKGMLGQGEGTWELSFGDAKAAQVLAFTLAEVREARLVPVLDFKGRQGKKMDVAPTAAAASGVDGGKDR